MNNTPVLFFKDNLWQIKCAVCPNLITNKYKSQIKQRTCSHSCQLRGNQYRKGQTGNQTSFRKGDPRTVGAANPNWKGGISPLAEQIRRLVPYIEWRTKVYVKDNYTCRSCGQRGGRLEADHFPMMFYKIMERYKITSVQQALNCVAFWDTSNGQTLCIKCHKVKTLEDMKTVPYTEQRMRGLSRAGGKPGRKWKR